MTIIKNQEHEIRRRLLRSFHQKELREIVRTDDSSSQLTSRREFEEHIITNWNKFSEAVQKTINRNMFLASHLE